MAESQLIIGFRLNAANCFDLAKEFPDPERKLALLDMAAAWMRLADITEKFGDMPLVGTRQTKPDA